MSENRDTAKKIARRTRQFLDHVTSGDADDVEGFDTDFPSKDNASLPGARKEVRGFQVTKAPGRLG